MRKLDYLLFMLLACLWSGSFIGIKTLVAVWPPLFGAALRVTLASFVLRALLMAKHKNPTLPMAIRTKVWVVGLFSQAIPFAFLFWGEQHVAPGLAGILNGTVPIWTFIFSLVFLPHTTQFTLNKVIGLSLGMMGIIVIFWPMVSFQPGSMAIFGAMSVLVMAMSYSVSNLLNQYMLKRMAPIDFLTNIYHQNWASMMALWIASYILEPWPNASMLLVGYKPWLACGYLAVFATVAAFVIYYHLIKQWDAVRASTVMYVVPVLAVFWDFVLLGRVPHHSEATGVAFILLGVVMIQLPAKKVFSKMTMYFSRP